ncbi:uncharacterized protein LOC142333239 isoform X2 [Lycorma delicatula]|uniref:uncharacterized protein LOC142333239 isoform X2 n=1 Tax=Lycorma delicatula TaxID=130591 RepID=UPI003F5197CE
MKLKILLLIIFFNQTLSIFEEFSIQLKVSRKGKNGPWNNIISITQKICEGIETYAKKTFEDIYAAANKKLECPIKKGVLEVKNYVVDFTPVAKYLGILPYGEYKAQVSYFSNRSNEKVLETCGGGLAEVRPLYEIQHKFGNATSGFTVRG